MKRKSVSLTHQIFWGLILGISIGIGINGFSLISISWVRDWVIEGAFYLGAQIFLRLLQVLVVPVVFVSLVCGTASLGGIKSLGRIGGKTLALYTGTTLLAVTIGLTFAILISPGAGYVFQSGAQFSAPPTPSIREVILELFPKNIFQSFSSGDMLPVIIFSILLGVAMSLSGKQGERVRDVFNDLNEVLMKLVELIIQISPLGVFCLTAKVFSEQGWGAFVPLAKYFLTVALVLIGYGTLAYSFLLRGLSGLSPWIFFKKYYEVMLFAFSTSSSNATLPVSLETVEKKLGVSNSVAAFTIPLGATINMDGTAIMQGVASVFVAEIYGVDLGLSQYLAVILTATLASIGTAGVPGVGLIMLSMVFQQVGIPIEGIGIIMAVDRPLDMLRTAVNVTGDAVVTCIVAKSEKQFDEKVFRDL